MIASEFWRAKESAEFPADVRSCYERARELMGVLESEPFETSVAVELQPAYREFSNTRLAETILNTHENITGFSERLATAFERAAEKLREASHA